MTLTPRMAFDLYESGTFALQEYGAALDARLFVDFHAMSVSCDHEAAAVHTAVGRELAQRIASWRAGTGGGTLHRISYIRRNACGELQGWLLFHLPAVHELRVRAWLSKWFARYADKQGNARWLPQLDYRPSSDPRDAVSAQWRSLRLIWGGLHPQDYVGALPLLHLLKVRGPDRHHAGFIHAARFHTSASIGPGAREAAASDVLGHVSAWRAGRWDQLFTGWELREHRERQRERDSRAAFDAALAVRRAATRDLLAIAHIEQIAAQENQRRSVPPELRVRAGPLWPSSPNANQRGE
jgi:hypothetical protein